MIQGYDMNSKREMIRFLLAGMGLGAISTLVGSIAFTLYDVFRQAQEWGWAFTGFLRDIRE